MVSVSSLRHYQGDSVRFPANHQHQKSLPPPSYIFIDVFILIILMKILIINNILVMDIIMMTKGLVWHIAAHSRLPWRRWGWSSQLLQVIWWWSNIVDSKITHNFDYFNEDGWEALFYSSTYIHCSVVCRSSLYKWHLC